MLQRVFQSAHFDRGYLEWVRVQELDRELVLLIEAVLVEGYAVLPRAG
jgi:hypothetical protein